MWIALCVPFMLLGCVIAIVPVLVGSVRDCKAQATTPRGDQQAAATAEPAGAGPVEVVCPPCGAVLRAPDTDDLLEVVRDHSWRHHGMPHPERVLAASRTARPARAAAS